MKLSGKNFRKACEISFFVVATLAALCSLVRHIISAASQGKYPHWTFKKFCAVLTLITIARALTLVCISLHRGLHEKPRKELLLTKTSSAKLITKMVFVCGFALLLTLRIMSFLRITLPTEFFLTLGVTTSTLLLMGSLSSFAIALSMGQGPDRKVRLVDTNVRLFTSLLQSAAFALIAINRSSEYNSLWLACDVLSIIISVTQLSFKLMDIKMKRHLAASRAQHDSLISECQDPQMFATIETSLLS